jgi:predicted  nucleic acid-binding Zn-ribbon protein
MAQPPKDVRTIVREGIVGLKDQIEDGFRNLKADLDIQLEQDRRSERDPRDLAAQVTHLEEELQQCRDEKRKERNRTDPVSEAQIQSLQDQIQILKDRAKNKGNWTTESAPNVRLLQAKNVSLEDQVRRLQDQLHNAGNADTVRVRQLEADKSHLELETQRLTAEVDALRASSSSTAAAENQKLEELVRRLQRELRILKDANKNQAAGVIRRIIEEEQNLPLDPVLARDYFNLVGETLKLQRKYYPAGSDVRPVIAADASEFQKEYFGQWTMGFTEWQLNYRTRQVIFFTLVCDAIINSFYFDTDDTPQGGMERLLALLEAEFTKAKGE